MGSAAYFSATMNKAKDTPDAVNIAISVGEFHAKAVPPRFNATTMKERHATSMNMPIRSTFLNASRNDVMCEGARGIWRVRNRKTVTKLHGS